MCQTDISMGLARVCVIDRFEWLLGDPRGTVYGIIQTKLSIRTANSWSTRRAAAAQ